MKVRTEAVQFKADQKLVDFIEKKLQKLEQFFDKIIALLKYIRVYICNITKYRKPNNHP